MVTISELSFSTPEKRNHGNTVKNMSISVPYRGTYDGTIEVVKALSSSPRRIVVDNLLMERGSDSEITGNMSLKIYSLEGIADTDPEVIEVATVEGPSEGSLFASYEGYVEGSGGSGGGGTAIDEKDYAKVYLLHDFEIRNYSFIPSNENIKGDAEPSTIKKSGKYSLRFEYNIFIGQGKGLCGFRRKYSFNYPPG